MTDTRAEWLARRRNYVTATDACQILGTSPHGGEWEVWREKQGHEEDIGDVGQRGHELEPLIAELAPMPLVKPWDPMIVRDGWASATVDRIVAATEGEAQAPVVEIKSTVRRLGAECEPHWRDQALHQCYVCGAPSCIVYAVSAPEWVFDAVRAGTATLQSAIALRQARWHSWEIEAIDYTARADRLREWHRRHIVEGAPPDVADGGPASRAWLAGRAEERADEVPVDEELEDLARRYAQAREGAASLREGAKNLESEASDLSGRLIQLLTDRGAKRAVGDGVRITAVDRKGRRSFDRTAFEAAHPDLVAKFVKEGAATVSVRVTLQ